MSFSRALLNRFAQLCYMGDLARVKKVVESGSAPDLLGHETPYKWGYVALTLFGAQRVVVLGGMGTPPDHIGTLEYLLKHGAPADVPDILGYTALHHACMARPRVDIARVLLEHGANPDWQDRFDSVALVAAFQNNSLDAIDVLMEFGASLDIADADGHTPDRFFVRCGPQVTALVQKWKRRRAGAEDPLDAKACAVCGVMNVQLKWCGKCHGIWYCSKECQKKHWPIHKKGCVPFSTESTVTLKPVYDDGITSLSSSSEIARYFLLGQPMAQQTPRSSRGVAIPRIPKGQTKTMIIKVQVPFDYKTGAGEEGATDDLLVYDKKRSFVCRVRMVDNPDGYQRISEVVRTKGVMGAKAYFPAEMKSPDEFVVKISEVLAEQAF
ncbi:hypothetical protein C8Q78DRAFT_1081820 [Trametes maxima]|nr:hypothetical protein C8Q78DRAFT_1081820 [Trametes maxima]